MLKRKCFLLGAPALSLFLLIGSLSLAGGSGIQINLAGESAFTISFDASKNKIGTDPYVSGTFYSGNGTAATGLGNNISFAYSGLANPTDAWQTIQGGGYFTNTDPIHGMESIQLTKSDSSSNLQIFWSATPTFSDTESATYDSSSALTFTCDFSGYYPNYIKVVALGSSSSKISSGTISFSCTERHNLGSSFYLGRYPQTVVEDSATLTALASATDTDSDGYLECGSEEYKKVDSATVCYGDADYKSASGNVTFTYGKTYYFKVEPIQWRVLSGQTLTTGLVMAEKVLTNGAYSTSTSNRTISSSTVYPNNYQYSTLRAMLNGYDGSAYSVDNFTGKGFLDVAFTDAERAYITTSIVDNSAATTESSSNPYACASTSDKLFALSYQDLLTTSYGFASSSGSSSTRYGVLTDYARATGTWMSTKSNSYYGNGCWWSRSPRVNDSGNAVSVDNVGYLYTYNVDYPNDGVRPSFTVDLG
jgi:hypothetical protein